MSILDLTADVHKEKRPTSHGVRSSLDRFRARWDYLYQSLAVLAAEGDPDVWVITTYPGVSVITADSNDEYSQDFTFYGGKAYEVSDALATDLTTAGYTVVDPIVFTYPANWSTIPEPDTITGEALAANNVEKVEVKIYSRDNDDYWNGSTWQAGAIWLETTLSEANILNPTWSYFFNSYTGTTTEAYWMPTRVTDVDGNVSDEQYWNFYVVYTAGFSSGFSRGFDIS